MNINEMTEEELLLYRASVEIYGTSRELYELDQEMMKLKEERKGEQK